MSSRLRTQAVVCTLALECTLSSFSWGRDADAQDVMMRRTVFPVRRRIHCGIGRLVFWALANLTLVRKVLWDCGGVSRCSFVYYIFCNKCAPRAASSGGTYRHFGGRGGCRCHFEKASVVLSISRCRTLIQGWIALKLFACFGVLVPEVSKRFVGGEKRLSLADCHSLTDKRSTVSRPMVQTATTTTQPPLHQLTFFPFQVVFIIWRLCDHCNNMICSAFEVVFTVKY